MRVIVLGSAAGGGFPQWNCNCAGCRRARAGDEAAPSQTQSSIAVSADGERWILLNASPDLRQQILATPALHPRALASGERGSLQDAARPPALRDSPIASVAVTDGDLDHVLGLLLLREGHAFSLYGQGGLLQSLDENPIFGVLPRERVPRRPLALDRPTPLADAGGAPLGLTLTAFAVPGKVALYREGGRRRLEVSEADGSVIGLELAGTKGGGRLVYIPGCAAVTQAVRARVAGASALFFDGTLWRNEELIEGGYAAKTGQRMGHISMSRPQGAMAALSGLPVGRRIFLHINNTNPVLLHDSPERAEALAAGWEIACDGMEMTL